MSEKEKIYTVLVTSDRHGKTKCFTLSVKWLRAILFFGFLGVTVLVTALVDYMGLLFESRVNRRLYLENERLRHQFEVVDSKLQSLEGGLERVRSFSTKLKLITNVGDEDRVIRLAMGGPTPVGDYENRELHFNEGVENLRKKHTHLVKDVSQKDETLEFRFPASEKSFVRGRNHLSTLQSDGKESYRYNGGVDYARLSFRIDKATKATEWEEQNVLQLWERLSDRRSLLKATPSIIPVKGWVTSSFGYRMDPFLQKPVMHNGMDIAARLGSKIRAPADGIVTFIGNGESSGKVLVIDHGYGVQTRFAHNSVHKVKVGSSVVRGQVIALVGNTGRSTGPHLHYEVRVNGVPVDPKHYVLEL